MDTSETMNARATLCPHKQTLSQTLKKRWICYYFLSEYLIVDLTEAKPVRLSVGRICYIAYNFLIFATILLLCIIITIGHPQICSEKLYSKF